MTDKFIFPEIASLSKDFHRPFWSVMILTYNGIKYLEETLKVLDKEKISKKFGLYLPNWQKTLILVNSL